MPTSHKPRLTLRELAGAALERRGTQASGARVRAWCESWHAGVTLIILCLAVYLPGLRSIPPVDRDESRFAQASRTMLESGDYVVPRIQGKPRLNKPPLIYWLQAASAWALGDGPGADGLGEWGNGNIWVFRVPSVLCAIGTVLLTWRLGLRMFDARAAVLGAALLAVCPMVVWDAHQARADQLLLLTTVGAMHALFACWKHTRAAAMAPAAGVARAARPPVVWVLTFWIWIGLGALAKGPVCPMIAGLAIVMLCVASRKVRWVWSLQPVVGLCVVAGMVGPWVWMVGQANGWPEYWSVVWHETIGRSAEAAEGHWGPPGYHTVLLAVLFWPGSLLTLAAVVRCWKRGLGGRRLRAGRSAEMFLLAWAVPAWIVFELIATKLPHYTMPLYPAIAMLSARATLAATSRGCSTARKIADWFGYSIWIAIGAGIFLVGAVVGSEEVWAEAGVMGRLTGVLPVVAAVMLLYVALRSGRLIQALAVALLGVVLWCWIVLGWAIPSSPIWVSKRIAVEIAQLPRGASKPLALVGYQEDSAVFWMRGRAERILPGELATWMDTHPDGVAVVQTLGLQDTLTSPLGEAHEAMKRAHWTRLFDVGGYNYSIGRNIFVRGYSRSGD